MISCSLKPFGQSVPWFTGCAGSPFVRTGFPSFTPMYKPHPTPQYPQVERTQEVGLFASDTFPNILSSLRMKFLNQFVQIFQMYKTLLLKADQLKR